MSRNKDRIIKTLAKYNLEAEEIDWQPIGKSFEMCGPEGGWFVRLTNGNIYMAYSINELINEIETYEGHHTDIESIQKYCNHVPRWKDGWDHSKGMICAKCKKDLDDDYVRKL